MPLRALPQALSLALIERPPPSPPQEPLQRLAVHPDRQGEGLGIALVADALHWLRRRSVQTCWVNTQEANAAALSLYTRLGFTPAAHQLTVLRRDL